MRPASFQSAKRRLAFVLASAHAAIASAFRMPSGTMRRLYFQGYLRRSSAVRARAAIIRARYSGSCQRRFIATDWPGLLRPLLFGLGDRLRGFLGLRAGNGVPWDVVDMFPL